jgi:hypothetical protein
MVFNSSVENFNRALTISLRIALVWKENCHPPDGPLRDMIRPAYRYNSRE